MTLLYGSLFLLSGAGLLTVTNFLVRHAVARLPVKGFIPAPGTTPKPVDPFALPPPSDHQAEVHLAEEAVTRSMSALVEQFLIQSWIALALMSVISIALGWIVAGRILSRLRTITAAARDISATNLHRRLALDGPGDELKELGDTFDDLLGRLDAAFRAQRQFVANASHELRTPLARQRALGQVALCDPDATVGSLRAAHERILIAGAQQERLIEALLTLTRGYAGIDVHHPFDLGQLTNEVIEAHRLEAVHRTVTIQASISPALATGHRPLAERLVTNLLDNAIRHNAPHGRVKITTGIVDGHPVLTVANTGPVVPSNAVEQLFQPFQRLGTARADRGEGLGLGLSIVQAIATAHAATITASARSEGGLTIAVTFPIPRPAPPPSAQARTTPLVSF
ncbi:HAMP domain-containing protein [Nonomuraea sp. KC401]|nr:HAMP domain-containing protein [Nonomuraea sp. K271]TLF73427.1 HAMP domain-containing protein [Nonomuraea sp. KC401]